MPAPRIDTLRNQLAASQTMLAKAGSILDTLHQLAYDRATANDVRVRGGQPDYALDTHGDPNARRAYTDLAHLIDHLCQQVATRVHPALAIVTDAEDTSGRRHPYAITAREHAEALDAQARRIARGEFDPGRTETQPQIPKSRKTLAGKITALDADLKRERRRADRAEAEVARLRDRTVRP